MAGKEYIEANIHVHSKTGCWIWQGTCYSSGYGYCRTVYSNSTLAHKVAYEAFVGLVPEGRRLRKLCGQKNCCNPEHHEVIYKEMDTIENKRLREEFLKSWNITNDYDSHVAKAVGIRAELKNISPDESWSVEEFLSVIREAASVKPEEKLTWRELAERMFKPKS